jgi:hypothetical protein
MAFSFEIVLLAADGSLSRIKSSANFWFSISSKVTTQGLGLPKAARDEPVFPIPSLF